MSSVARWDAPSNPIEDMNAMYEALASSVQGQGKCIVGPQVASFLNVQAAEQYMRAYVQCGPWRDLILNRDETLFGISWTNMFVCPC